MALFVGAAFCTHRERSGKVGSGSKRSESGWSRKNAIGVVKNFDKATVKFVQFLYERFKALKDMRSEIVQREGSLQEFSLGYNLFGFRRLPCHAVEYMEWAPGSEYCALIGDFNDWDQWRNPAFHQRNGRWKARLEDKVRRGEAEDPFWQEYNCTQEYDHGDEDETLDVDAIVKGISSQYWEPGENESSNKYAYPKERILGKNPDFPYWERLRKGYRAWEKKYKPCIGHGSQLQVYFETAEGPLQRVPAWATYVFPDVQKAVFWDPPPEERHEWKHPRPEMGKALRIYECHVGISGGEHRISTFKDFISQMLPYVKEAGYNVIQLFGIQEHADYASVGYKVTNPFAVSSRFGNPEEFKCLVDTAHGLGILVFLDIVHSHFARDEGVGLSNYDGVNDCYCYSTSRRGHHSRWRTRILDYGDHEVKRYLLSNLRWWVEEYRIDGFQFHSVASMLYKHNGFSNFTGDINEYTERVDIDAQIYLILANEMLHSLKIPIITVAEDVTHYPGLSVQSDQGGLGFDYYVNTHPSDVWLYSIEHVPLEAWDIKQILKALMDIPETGGTPLVYVENHSQSVSGGKSMFQALLDMNSELPLDESMLKSTSIFKVIKLLTVSLGGDAYLNFMGNEFGHPGHIEFPRGDNDFSFEHACRRWELLQEKWHSELAAFDQALMKAEETYSIMVESSPLVMHKVDETSKVLNFTRGKLLFVFNFHTSTNYEITVDELGRYEVVIDTDQAKFGGLGRLQSKEGTSLQRIDVTTLTMPFQLPALSGQVYRLVATWDTSRR